MGKAKERFKDSKYFIKQGKGFIKKKSTKFSGRVLIFSLLMFVLLLVGAIHQYIDFRVKSIDRYHKAEIEIQEIEYNLQRWLSDLHVCQELKKSGGEKEKWVCEGSKNAFRTTFGDKPSIERLGRPIRVAYSRFRLPQHIDRAIESEAYDVMVSDYQDALNKTRLARLENDNLLRKSDFWHLLVSDAGTWVMYTLLVLLFVFIYAVVYRYDYLHEKAQRIKTKKNDNQQS